MTDNSVQSQYEHPIGPVGISTPEEMGAMPHRRLKFPSPHARDVFLARAMQPLDGPSEADFTALEAPLARGKYDAFFRKSGHELVIRAWTRDPAAQGELNDFILANLYEANDEK